LFHLTVRKLFQEQQAVVELEDGCGATLLTVMVPCRLEFPAVLVRQKMSRAGETFWLWGACQQFVTE